MGLVSERKRERERESEKKIKRSGVHERRGGEGRGESADPEASG